MYGFKCIVCLIAHNEEVYQKLVLGIINLFLTKLSNLHTQTYLHIENRTQYQ